MALDSVSAQPNSVVATSVWRFLLSRLKAAHSSALMGAFAGPPGIGKTTAIKSFKSDHYSTVAVVTVRQDNARPSHVLQRMLAAVYEASGFSYLSIPNGKYALERQLDQAITDWRWRSENQNLSVVFDEAQNLSPQAIETLRFWNDGTDDTAPIGVIFIGNNKFRLESDVHGPSFLSAAVSSRASFRKTFTYEDISDEDLRLIIEDNRSIEAAATVDLINYCKSSRINRDLRQLEQLLKQLTFEAGGNEILASSTRNALGLT